MERAKVTKRPSKAWKAFEYHVATYFGGRRVPLSGSNSGHDTSADCFWKADSPMYPLRHWFYIEAKRDKQYCKPFFPIWKEFLAGKIGYAALRGEIFYAVHSTKYLKHLRFNLPHAEFVAEQGFNMHLRSSAIVGRLWRESDVKAQKEKKLATLVVLKIHGKDGFIIFSNSSGMVRFRHWLNKIAVNQKGIEPPSHKPLDI